MDGRMDGRTDGRQDKHVKVASAVPVEGPGHSLGIQSSLPKGSGGPRDLWVFESSATYCQWLHVYRAKGTMGLFQGPCWADLSKVETSSDKGSGPAWGQSPPRYLWTLVNRSQDNSEDTVTNGSRVPKGTRPLAGFARGSSPST